MWSIPDETNDAQKAIVMIIIFIIRSIFFDFISVFIARMENSAYRKSIPNCYKNNNMKEGRRNLVISFNKIGS